MLNLKFNKTKPEQPEENVPVRDQNQEMTPKQEQMLPSGNTEEFSASSTGEASHFDDLIEAEEPSGADAIAAEHGAVLNEDDFHKVFILCFTVSHNVTKLNSLKVEEHDGAAKNCSKAIYEMILEIPALHFLLNPSGKWGQRAFMIGSFALPMAMNVRAEISARKSEKAQPKMRGETPTEQEREINLDPKGVMKGFA